MSTLKEFPLQIHKPLPSVGKKQTKTYPSMDEILDFYHYVPSIKLF